MTECWIGIGANLGEPKAAFDDAWSALGRIPGIQLQQRSGLFQTAPIGPVAGAVFTNAVFSLTTKLSPLELLDRLQAIENLLGRRRDTRWGPRPLDLDLLYFDQQILQHPRLILPHPAAWYRQFVVVPLLEIAADLVHPLFHQSVSELQSRLASRPLRVAILDREWANALESVTTQFSNVQFLDSVTDAPDVLLKLNDPATVGATIGGVPIADLTMMPGDARQRVTDFLESVLDVPVRTGDW